jgi:hypothetical protein
MATASYTKLKSGEWGVRIVGTASAGQTITVTKKDGTSKQETITKIVWSGNGITLAAVAQRAPQASKSKSYSDCDDFCQGCRKCM